MENLTKLLEDIGLTNAEAKTYLALTDLGQTTVGPIADKSGVAYSKIYILLEKLIQKGLASSIIKNKTRYFNASTPRKLLDYIDRKKDEVESQKKKIEENLLFLEKRMHQIQIDERAELYEGYEGLKTIYEESLALLNKGDEVLVMGASLGAYTDKKKYELFFKQINRIRLTKGIAYRIIYNENFKGEAGVKFWQEQKLTNVRFLLQNTPGSVNIQGDKVLIIYWANDNPKIFVISSEIVASSFRQYFESLWNISKY